MRGGYFLEQEIEKNILLGVCVVALNACVSTSRPLEMGKDTYSISATADGYRTAAAARESAFETGAKYCSSRGKKFMFLNEQSARTRMGIDTTIDVVFRCLSESDPEYSRPDVRIAPDVLIEDSRSK